MAFSHGMHCVMRPRTLSSVKSSLVSDLYFAIPNPWCFFPNLSTPTTSSRDLSLWEGLILKLNRAFQKGLAKIPMCQESNSACKWGHEFWGHRGLFGVTTGWRKDNREIRAHKEQKSKSQWIFIKNLWYAKSTSILETLIGGTRSTFEWFNKYFLRIFIYQALCCNIWTVNIPNETINQELNCVVICLKCYKSSEKVGFIKD